MLQKLTIQRCDVDQSSQQVIPKAGAANLFAALINPAEVKHSHGIDYSDTEQRTTRPIGDTDSKQTFASYRPETVSFGLVLDGTGVVPEAGSSRPASVRELVDKLKRICYDYQGEDHEPSVVKLRWGRTFENFTARLTELGIEYTMFKPSGEPLRAKLQLSFVRYRTYKEAQRAADQRSPDVTRVVRVCEGDTLPLLCERVYRDGGRYQEVARFNELTEFRRLTPGTLLRFPPVA